MALDEKSIKELNEKFRSLTVEQSRALANAMNAKYNERIADVPADDEIPNEQTEDKK